MRKALLILVFAIILSICCYAESSYNDLTKGYADSLYCWKDGNNCNINVTTNGTVIINNNHNYINNLNISVDGNFSYTPSTGYFTLNNNWFTWLYNLFFTKTEIKASYDNRLNYSKEVKDSEVWLTFNT